MSVTKLLIFTLFTNVLLYSDDNNLIKKDESSIIDDAHKNTSEYITNISKFIDTKLSGIFIDANESCDASTNNCSLLKQEIDSIDDFQKNEKYIDDTDKSFVRLRLNSRMQSIGNNENSINLRAHLALKKSKQRFKFFIESMKNDNFSANNPNSLTDEESSTRIGLSYFSPEYYTIESKYSIGIKSLDPYLKARYKKNFQLQDWIIEPNQSFEYDINDDKFEEDTYVYFDTKIDDSKFFRILLSRGTESRVDGMDYGAALTYTYSPKKNTSIGLSQSFSGNTDYTYVENDNTIKYSGINTYTTQINLRQNIWKKWFYYEIIPGVSFQKTNDYKENYHITFLTDFYFGYYK